MMRCENLMSREDLVAELLHAMPCFPPSMRLERSQLESMSREALAKLWNNDASYFIYKAEKYARDVRIDHGVKRDYLIQKGRA